MVETTSRMASSSSTTSMFSTSTVGWLPEVIIRDGTSDFGDVAQSENSVLASKIRFTQRRRCDCASLSLSERPDHSREAAHRVGESRPARHQLLSSYRTYCPAGLVPSSSP